MSVYLKNRKSKQMLQLFDEETPKEIIEVRWMDSPADPNSTA